MKKSEGPDSSANEPTGQRGRKVFVIKQTISRRGASGGTAKICRILVFDNHPDSLRLAIREHADVPIDSAKTSAGSWHVLIVSLIAAGGLLGMLWPLF
jgi:hypothetical protein